jgi:hypothetical protein
MLPFKRCRRKACPSSRLSVRPALAGSSCGRSSEASGGTRQKPPSDWRGADRESAVYNVKDGAAVYLLSRLADRGGNSRRAALARISQHYSVDPEQGVLAISLDAAGSVRNAG